MVSSLFFAEKRGDVSSWVDVGEVSSLFFDKRGGSTIIGGSPCSFFVGGSTLSISFFVVVSAHYYRTSFNDFSFLLERSRLPTFFKKS